MIFLLPVVLTTLLSLTTISFTGATQIGGRKCGNHLTSEDIDAKESKFANALSRMDNPVQLASEFSNYTIPVHFHVIYARKILSRGYIPDEQIKDQIEVLNRDYTGTGLTFKLVNTTRTKNRKWFENVTPATPEQEEMKKKLRCGGPNALNVFSVSFDNKNASDFLGYATLPSGYNDNPKDDGVVVRYSTLPGGIHAPTNLGRTLTHETGHWVGLYHTFEGGCEGKGDYVSDTPPEADAAHGCPAGRRTCGSKGLDPIHNFMDYTDDACMDNFTRGQAVRLRHQIYTYRNIPL